MYAVDMNLGERRAFGKRTVRASIPVRTISIAIIIISGGCGPPG